MYSWHKLLKSVFSEFREKNEEVSEKFKFKV
jgi:hypothetical protein